MGASAITGGIGAGLGLYQTISGAVQAREAKDALNNYQRQDLENVARDLQVSTMGSDLQREEQGRLASSQVDALQSAGTRGLIGGLARVEAGNQKVMRETGADLDRQQKEIDRMFAQDQANIRGLQESRENADIAALSSQFSGGRQDMYSGLGNVVQGTGMIANNIDFGKSQKFGTPGFDATTAVSNNSFNPNSFSGTKSGGSGMGSISADYLTLDPNSPNYGNTAVSGVRSNPRASNMMYNFEN